VLFIVVVAVPLVAQVWVKAVLLVLAVAVLGRDLVERKVEQPTRAEAVVEAQLNTPLLVVLAVKA